MADFKLFFPILLNNEGYYSNVVNDTGGETWEGVSRNNYPHWSGWIIIDSYKSKPNFPHSLRNDIELEKLVESFYKPTFWDSIQGDKIINQSLANFIADWGVNSGISIPVKHSQEILELAIDGQFGPKTLAAINANSNQEFFNKLQEARKQFYLAVVMAHPADKKFLNNWLTRTASFKFVA